MKMTLENVVDALNEIGITDVAQQAGVLAQIKAESGFKPRSENMNYSGDRLWQVFPKYFKNKEEAYKIAKQGPEAIANRVYGGRMGNASDEGFKYRGRGLIQLTGKNNYQRYGKMIGEDLVKNPDLANDPEIAFKLAVAYLQDTSKDLSDPLVTTLAVGPVNAREKAKERGELQESYISRISKLNPEAQPAEPTKSEDPIEQAGVRTVPSKKEENDGGLLNALKDLVGL